VPQGLHRRERTQHVDCGNAAPRRCLTPDAKSKRGGHARMTRSLTSALIATGYSDDHLRGARDRGFALPAEAWRFASLQEVGGGTSSQKLE
jgi:hypothetical protein